MEKTTKLLGGWGYVALIVGGFLGFFLGPFSGIITLAGLVCVLIAFFRASTELNLPSVKRDILIAIVLNVIAYVLFIFIVGAAVFALVMHSRASGDVNTGAAAAFGVGTILAGVIAWVLMIIGSWYWYKASQALTDGTGVGTYKTGGLLIFIGSIALIVFFIGGIVILIGEIIQAVAFFSTQEQTPDSLEPPSASAG